MTIYNIMNYRIFFLLYIITFTQSMTAQTDPKGKAIINIYTNIHSGFGSYNDKRGFELERSYLGYQYTLSEQLTLKAIMDIGYSDNVNDFHRIAYIKNAMVQWRKNQWIINAGLIGTTQFKLQETFWDKRYIIKSFQDEHKFGSSADLGISVTHKLGRYFEIDAIVVNGEGYKKLQIKDGFLYGIGITYMPNKKFIFRSYISFNEAIDKQYTDEIVWNIFGGYNHSNLSIGYEYTYQYNRQYTKDNDYDGMSAYITYNIGKKYSLFGRWDYISSSQNKNANKHIIYTGFEWQINKFIKISPNVRYYICDDFNKKDAIYLYINAAFIL